MANLSKQWEPAEFVQVDTKAAPLQLFIGPWQMSSESAVVLADVAKWQLCAITATGITPFVAGTHTAAQACVATEAVVAGKRCPYWDSGYFNWEAIGWPAGAQLDTFEEIKAFFAGYNMKFGHLI